MSQAEDIYLFSQECYDEDTMSLEEEEDPSPTNSGSFKNGDQISLFHSSDQPVFTISGVSQMTSPNQQKSPVQTQPNPENNISSKNLVRKKPSHPKIGRNIKTDNRTEKGESFRSRLISILHFEPSKQFILKWAKSLALANANEGFPFPPRKSFRNKDFFYTFYSKYQKYFLDDIPNLSL